MDETESLSPSSDERVLLDDRYELVERIGSGGMAEVWRARDVRLQRDVAVKLLSGPSAADPSRRRRIEREARALATTNHPNIVAVYDYGEAEGSGGDVRPYVVMELVDGPDLHHYLHDRGALPADEARDIMVGILTGVQRAHESGLVHGDLKPANVFVGSHGPKVGDFGVARILDEETGMTTAAATPTFAAPEVLKGERPSTRSDVYSAACLAFELLTARPPYEGANGWEIAAKHIDAPVPRIRPFRSDVPAEFESVVQRGMEKDPKRRHADAKSFADALSAIPLAGTTGTVPVDALVAGIPMAQPTENLGSRPDLQRAAMLGPLATVPDRVRTGARWVGDRLAHSRHRRALLVILLALLMLFAFLTLRDPGVASVTVPGLHGQTYQDAAAKLQKRGLRVDDVSFRPVAEGKPGRVLRTIPAEGSQVAEGTKVHIIATVVPATPRPETRAERIARRAQESAQQAGNQGKRGKNNKNNDD